MDFIWSRGARVVGIEVKASARWRPEHGRALRERVDSGVVSRGFGVYTGDSELRDGAVRVLPWRAFLEELARGRVVLPG